MSDIQARKQKAQELVQVTLAKVERTNKAYAKARADLYSMAVEAGEVVQGTIDANKAAKSARKAANDLYGSKIARLCKCLAIMAVVIRDTFHPESQSTFSAILNGDLSRILDKVPEVQRDWWVQRFAAFRAVGFANLNSGLMEDWSKGEYSKKEGLDVLYKRTREADKATTVLKPETVTERAEKLAGSMPIESLTALRDALTAVIEARKPQAVEETPARIRKPRKATAKVA